MVDNMIIASDRFIPVAPKLLIHPPPGDPFYPPEEKFGGPMREPKENSE